MGYKDEFDSRKYRPLEEVLKEMFPELRGEGLNLINEYIDALGRYGLESYEVQELYGSIIKGHKDLKDWLDSSNLINKGGYGDSIR